MKILIVDDEPDICDRIAQILSFEGWEAAVAHNGLSAQRLLEQDVFAAVVTDLNMPGLDGLSLLHWIKAEGPDVPVIMMSAYGAIADAVAAMKAGAEDYLVKPFDLDEFLIRLRRIITHAALQKQVYRGQQHDLAPSEWIGASPSMQAIHTLIQKVAPTPSTVLITGESGTGKEVIANTIHRLSPRAEQPFIPINVAGVPENLLESELFGYEKGAFTGATARKIGMFEVASSGTLFLDEIGDMPMPLQGKLLRVLQERSIQRLGGTRSLPIDVRILSATNKHLEEQIKHGLFREDLYYRLNVIHIKLPPLRERREDIPFLVGHFLQKSAAALGKVIRGIDAEALAAIESYAFPGNIRELENMIERAVILADRDTLSLKELDIMPLAITTYVKPGTLDDIQKHAIQAALLRWEGNKTKAAEELGISRQTILNKIREYGLEHLVCQKF